MKLTNNQIKILNNYANYNLDDSINCVALMRDLLTDNETCLPADFDQTKTEFIDLLQHQLKVDWMFKTRNREYQFFWKLPNDKYHVLKTIYANLYISKNGVYLQPYNKFVTSLINQHPKASYLSQTDQQRLHHEASVTLNFLAFDDHQRLPSKDMKIIGDFQSDDVAKKILTLAQDPYQYLILYRNIKTNIKSKYDYFFDMLSKRDNYCFDYNFFNVSYQELTANQMNSIYMVGSKRYPDIMPFIKLPANKEQSAIAGFMWYLLINKQDERIPAEYVQPLFDLIYYQQKSFNIKVDNKNMVLNNNERTYSNAMKQFVHYFGFDTTFDNTISYYIIDVAQYIANILTNRALNPKMLQAISHNNTPDIIKRQIKVDHLENILLMPTEKERNKVLDQLDSAVKKHVTQIYKINKPHNLKHYQYQQMLAHGTQNLSVLSILANGLLDVNTLEAKHETHYQYTGSGLGNGIYFSRLNECTKSYYYTSRFNGSNVENQYPSYMFICTVGYNEKNDVDSYSSLANGDLVWAHGVGTGDRDEIMAREPKQIELNYLLELR